MKTMQTQYTYVCAMYIRHGDILIKETTNGKYVHKYMYNFVNCNFSVLYFVVTTTRQFCGYFLSARRQSSDIQFFLCSVLFLFRYRF